MRFKRYLLTLLLVPVLLFSVKSYASNKIEENYTPTEKPLRPFFVEVVNPDGSIVDYRGESRKMRLSDIVSDLDVIYYPEDRLSIFPDIYMEMGGKITLKRAPVVNLKDGKKKFVYRSWAGTVGELLTEKKIELGADDKITPSLESGIKEGSDIQINRVAITTIIETKDIDFITTKKNDPDLDEGKTRIEQKGVKGKKDYYYLVTRQDGEEVSRKLTDTKVTLEPVTEIIMIGTKPVITVACRFNSTVIAAAIKYNIKANDLCYRMMKESRGNPNSDGGAYKGLFQYEPNFWSSASSKAGYAGASIWDAEAQIFVTAWAWTHGYRSRWPIP